MKRRWVPALVLGGLWWWAVLRLVLHPDQAGLVEGTVAAGGWGLSLLPVHVAAVVPVNPVSPMGAVAPVAPVGSSTRWRPTRAWRRRRSAGGSDQS
ncbi:hypothetical protein [Streptomyces sp. ADI98-10]|uniref:hypothetical protein n=1 Tax=Streptomyces sp. ADI98-10 TaxID=1522763 RepID=UPI000F54F48A|nr:hypothetical protein [Streptomyces sp. ADI98-10]RPK90345.1 hypothetical protein EES46_13210 [Streptomyces sp. ADI98-10]